MGACAWAGGPVGAWASAIAVRKTSAPFLATFLKGIGANWLVNLAVFNAATANSAGGKMAVLWMPIATFVALGLEHSVANMFLIPLGMGCGADVTVSDFLFGNLVPCIAGNIVGASVCVGAGNWYALMP